MFSRTHPTPRATVGMVIGRAQARLFPQDMPRMTC